MNCPKCKGELRYIEEYQRYYCDHCQEWPEVGQAPQAQAAAPKGSTAYDIGGEIIPSVIFNLGQGQTIYSQPGVMIYRDPSVNMVTGQKGGIMKGLGRKLVGGEAFSTVEFKGPGKVAVSAGAPGAIVPLQVSGTAIRAKSGAFIASESGVEMETTREKIGTAIIGGTGLFQLRFFGNGIVFIQAKGDVISGSLKQGQSIVADENSFLACDDTVQRERQRVKGMRNILTGGEGLYLLKMTGPGRYWLETGGSYAEWVKQISKQ